VDQPSGVAGVYCSTHTRPQTFAKPSAPEVVIERVRYLEKHFQVANDTAAVTSQLIKLMERFQIGGKQVHDANIVAAMQAYDIPALLTHNTQDFKRFGEIITIQGI
jgi:predicted nucleic acid-binding protein